MKPRDSELADLLRLSEKSIEGQLTAEEAVLLEQYCTASPALLRAYVDYCALHANLRLNRGDSQPNVTLLDVEQHIETAKWPMQSILSKFLLAVSAAVLLSLTSYTIVQNMVRDAVIGELVEAKECRWNAGTLPTELNAKLTSGRLRLAEGLAAILLKSGVQLRVEGPADLEMVTSMKCIVHSGRVIAKVPPSGKGFVVETPSSVLTDYGTEFGVTVPHTGQEATVTVFQGRVDALHRTTGRTEQMSTGATVRFMESDFQRLGPHFESIAENTSSNVPKIVDAAYPSSQRIVQITTAQGLGKDAFIQPREIPPDRTSDSLLLVKRPIESMKEWERRAYLGFDLTTLHDETIDRAELSLTFASTGFGYAYLTPDATFTVYGITECEEWDEREISWGNAPAMWDIESPAPSSVTHLGSFVVPQGAQSSNYSISTETLRDFLNRNIDQVASIIVVRETMGLGSSDLVHGIASRRHPTLSPPTLRLLLK